MINLYIDIETVPANMDAMPKREDIEFYVDPIITDKEMIKARVPNSYSNPDTIRAWVEKNWEKAQELNKTAHADAYEKTTELHAEAYSKWTKGALSHFTGKIITIAYAVADGPIACVRLGQPGINTEKSIMAAFIEQIEIVYKEHQNNFRGEPIRWVAHNGYYFDFPFLWWKAIYYFRNAGMIPNTGLISKYSTQKIFDTMLHLPVHRYKEMVSLKKYLDLFNIESKSIMTGAEVLNYYLDGQMSTIGAYCANDVAELRELVKIIGEQE